MRRDAHQYGLRWLDVCFSSSSSFAPSLQTRVWREVSKSTNILKLLSAIPVLVGLLPYPQPMRHETMQCLLTLLGHASFPKVRRLTGESLYTALLMDEELVPGAELDPDKAQQVLDILTLTPWDGPVGHARQERDKLYTLLEVKKPVVKTKSANASTQASSSAAAVVQGDISALGTDYSSLVRNIGY